MAGWKKRRRGLRKKGVRRKEIDYEKEGKLHEYVTLLRNLLS